MPELAFRAAHKFNFLNLRDSAMAAVDHGLTQQAMIDSNMALSPLTSIHMNVPKNTTKLGGRADSRVVHKESRT